MTERIPNKIRTITVDGHAAVLFYLLSKLKPYQLDEVKAIFEKMEDETCILCDECEKEQIALLKNFETAAERAINQVRHENSFNKRFEEFKESERIKCEQNEQE